MDGMGWDISVRSRGYKYMRSTSRRYSNTIPFILYLTGKDIRTLLHITCACYLTHSSTLEVLFR